MAKSLPELGRAGVIGLGLLAALLLSGCASTGVNVANAGSEQLAPVQGGNVSTTALPPIGPNGEVQSAKQLDGLPPVGTDGTTQVATAGPNATLPPIGGLPNTSGRDLTGGLTPEKLLGRWTVVSGADQCALNLTQTQKTGTGRFRASAPACALKGLTAVASWSLAGSQVQLFDEGGNIIAALILSGNRFIGTLSGGQGISMVG
ncbi:MAG: AprI/Inh family metalloprotease inhibitor [Devosia sp.]